MRNFLPERRGRPRHSAVVLGRCFIFGREGRRARRAEGRRARPFARGSADLLREALLGIRVLPRTGAGAAGGALPATRVARCGRSGVLRAGEKGAAPAKAGFCGRAHGRRGSPGRERRHAADDRPHAAPAPLAAPSARAPHTPLTRRVYELPRHGRQQISRAMYPLLQAVNGGDGAQKNSCTQRGDGVRRGGREGRGLQRRGFASGREGRVPAKEGFWAARVRGPHCREERRGFG